MPPRVVSRARRTPRLRAAAVAAALLLTLSFSAPSQPASAGSRTSPPAAEAERWELYFRLEARVESLALDTEIEAGGRLRAASEEGADGGRSLVLTSVVEAPWKLYEVDPAGPGGEAKHAAVAVLPEVSWQALDAATAGLEDLGLRRYRRKPRSLPYDGAFTFVVLGAPAGRFRVELDAEGRVTDVRNHLTDHWLTGEFDALVAARREGRKVEGYWFWNAPPRPPSWEPHTYHAFAAALRLLAGPVAGDGGRVELPTLGDDLARVTATLAPRVEGRLPEGGGASALFRSRPGRGGFTVLEGEGSSPGGRGAGALSYRRRRVVEEGTGRVVEDVLEAGSRAGGRVLKLEVGYRRLGGEG